MTQRGDTLNSKLEYQLLEYQLALLRDEIQTINEIIARTDGMSRTTKNWAIVVWGGSMALVLPNESLRPYVLGTAVFPLLFWYLDALWRRIQARSIVRMAAIRKFINGQHLADSYSQGCVTDFIIFDPMAREEQESAAYVEAVSIRKTFFYKDVYVLYVFQALVSVGTYVSFA